MYAPVQLRRGSYAVAIALIVLAQLGALSHSAVARHVRCATHGELVDAAQVDAHSTDAVRLVGARTSGGADDHCELAAALHHDVTASVPAHTITQPLLAAATAVAPIGTPARSTVYRFAPKTSPPDRLVSIT